MSTGLCVDENTTELTGHGNLYSRDSRNARGDDGYNRWSVAQVGRAKFLPVGAQIWHILRAADIASICRIGCNEALRDSIVILASPLAIVCGLADVPCLGIHRASWVSSEQYSGRVLTDQYCPCETPFLERT